MPNRIAPITDEPHPTPRIIAGRGAFGLGGAYGNTCRGSSCRAMIGTTELTHLSDLWPHPRSVCVLRLRRIPRSDAVPRAQRPREVGEVGEVEGDAEHGAVGGEPGVQAPVGLAAALFGEQVGVADEARLDPFELPHDVLSAVVEHPGDRLLGLGAAGLAEGRVDGSPALPEDQ